MLMILPGLALTGQEIDWLWAGYYDGYLGSHPHGMDCCSSLRIQIAEPSSLTCMIFRQILS